MRYLKTIGLRTLVPVGRGFTFPYDTAFSSDGRMFVLNRERVTTPLGTRIQICTFEEEFLGEFGNGKGTGDDQFMVPVAMAFDSKLFLGERGRFNGEDVIDIICRQPATARFLARHLYSFFVADEAPVPQWASTPPRDPGAIETLAEAYVESGHDIRSVLRVLFNSDFFKEAQLSRFKSPIELIIGTLRLTGEHRVPDGSEPGIIQPMAEAGFMGQAILDPPSVEGWHTGSEWINSGSLIDRVNFAVDHMGDLSNPGVRDIVDRVVRECGDAPEAEALVDASLDMVGPLQVSDDTRSSLVELASREGRIDLGRYPDDEKTGRLMEDLLRGIVSSREYQLV